MQVTGQVARESGFRCCLISELCERGAGLEVGCAVSLRQLAESAGNVTRAFVRWNSGLNPRSASQVLCRMSRDAETDNESQPWVRDQSAPSNRCVARALCAGSNLDCLNSGDHLFPECLAD
jgi:hypothetical protein